MKLYFKIVGLILIFIAWFGFIGPYCVSNQTELVAGFILASLIIIPFTILLFRKELQMLKKFLLPCLILLASFSMIGCSKVPAGNVGIKFYLLGTNKGVDYEELKPGKYWIGFNEELYLFPVYTQNITWTKDKNKDEGDQSFNFQDRQGLELNADIGLSYHVNPSKVSTVFQKYKKGIDEITDIFLRNMIRDALVSRSSVLDVEYIYGEGRAGLIDSVKNDVKTKCDSLGIIIEELYWIGRIKLPAVVTNAINAKIQATQIAQQRENELREAEAAAKKQIAAAEGEAKSKLTIAEAEAKANNLLTKSLSQPLVNYKAIEKWNGVLPQVSGEVTPFININK